jgi:hypothetical protein
MLSKEVTKCFLKKSQKAFQRSHKKPSKEVTKSLLKKSQKAVTVTHICRLFTDKSCIKVLQIASQNSRHKIVTTG